MRIIDHQALKPWAGLFMGAFAWFVHHQGASDAIYWDCQLGGPLLTAGLGAVCAVVTIIGGLISWRARREAVGLPGARAFAGTVGAATAGIFLLTIGFQSLIGFIAPRCFPS